VDPVPDLSCFPPKTRNSGNKDCFYFGGKTPNLTIAATIFLLLQYTVAFLLSKLCAPVHKVNKFSPFCEPDLIISRCITPKSLELDRISTVAAKASCVNTFVFSVYSQIHQQNEPLTLLPLTCWVEQFCSLSLSLSLSLIERVTRGSNFAKEPTVVLSWIFWCKEFFLPFVQDMQGYRIAGHCWYISEQSTMVKMLSAQHIFGTKR